MQSALSHLPASIVDQFLDNHFVIRSDGKRSTKLARSRLNAIPPRKAPTIYGDGSMRVVLNINENRRLAFSMEIQPHCVVYNVLELHRRVHGDNTYFVQPPIYSMFSFTGRCILTSDSAECQWFTGLEYGFFDLNSQRYFSDPALPIPPVHKNPLIREV